MVLNQLARHEWQLTLVRLIAAVSETVGTAANQTQPAGETGRAAWQSGHWSANVCVPDGEVAARLLWGAAGMASGAVRHEEDQARKRETQNRVPHNVTPGFSVESCARRSSNRSGSLRCGAAYYIILLVLVIPRR